MRSVRLRRRHLAGAFFKDFSHDDFPASFMNQSSFLFILIMLCSNQPPRSKLRGINARPA